MNRITICSNCMYMVDCVLTKQKDKVWSCSEYNDDHLKNEVIILNAVKDRFMNLV
ncbi:hypothetical protein Q4566_03490 [Tamlana sp. 2_MG-2023]|nr:hypothetical protein [Tamlana sp. 2_MG-2023]MDO6790611.1 hypothetical protein [Tamlana sp. 1_MG-2023]